MVDKLSSNVSDAMNNKANVYIQIPKSKWHVKNRCNIHTLTHTHYTLIILNPHTYCVSHCTVTFKTTLKSNTSRTIRTRRRVTNMPFTVWPIESTDAGTVEAIHQVLCRSTQLYVYKSIHVSVTNCHYIISRIPEESMD